MHSAASGRFRAAGRASGDQILVARAQAGDRYAFDQLVLRHRSALVSLMIRYTHNRADAEDTAQEALISAYRGLTRFRGEAAFLTWLCRIAVNAAKTWLKLRARERLLMVAEQSERRGEHELPAALTNHETPENLALTEDVRTVVSATLQSLPEGYRIAISLREVAGLSYREIATTMSTPVGTVRSRVSRARDIIDQRLRTATSSGLGLPGHQRAAPHRAGR
jgi:RNA polymerase sigma-70 factor, ECF subfamily